ncbi:acetyl/propionyl/methylcrotonyl-CoA carboxylase subunit alpha [Ottowia sp. SB7-C50]|uniref:acetyl/propionyl/methylcrotonyl-CoA carboxylase subunit alpha n=1 Tax=Ottowia sp. SB7-C50 TaxID=3081231 RepID=UPI0029536777|nr:biotin carboxylase N-terminal domain-containing protein [Ottowia sp. SB7-C50]WOP16012.1 biotin carboxylase N-terminal domain-containing protein [Ottowia sp. SB7-C50]
MKRILIANRGEIARRIIATARRMGIETVAVYSEPDAQALHVREATVAFALGGRTSAESYLRVDRLLEAARATGADAVHPGYGFLSEDPAFAQAVQDAGLAWIGPPPAAIRALGSKSAAKALAAQHGVPCLPGYAGDDQSEARFADEAARIGYPVMVKAVAGGGGRGMRLVADAAQLPAALASARSEALAGFGNGDLLIERALLHPRHVEVQVFADAHGHVIHMGERDCSVQRRHQKIIEEAPSPAVDAALRECMGACAVALARAAGYVGAGTVEFLLDGRDFFLMEMNTRLQVEHPVTEALTGLDLVEWQIRTARGEPLPLTQDQVQFNGHAIEVRLCAEDEQFHPHTGRVRHFTQPPAAAFTAAPLRFDHALTVGAEVSPYYDAMLGKLIAHADTREAAIDQLTAALRQLEVLGLPTNRAFLIECLQHPRFRAGQALISFLTTDADGLRAELHARERLLHERFGALCVLGDTASALPCPFPAPRRLRHRGDDRGVSIHALGDGQWQVRGDDGECSTLQRQALADGAAWVTTGHSARRVAAVSAPTANAPQRWHMQAEGVDWWVDDVSFEPLVQANKAQAATELRAPFNGKVLKIAVQPGQSVAAGDAALVIESMKLEHSLAPRADGVVAEVLVSEGQQVAPGQLLLRFAAPVKEAAA